MKALTELAAQGKLKPRISHRFPLDAGGRGDAGRDRPRGHRQGGAGELTRRDVWSSLRLLQAKRSKPQVGQGAIDLATQVSLHFGLQAAFIYSGSFGFGIGHDFDHKTCPQAIDGLQGASSQVSGALKCTRTSTLLFAIALAFAGSAMAAPVTPFAPDSVSRAIDTAVQPDESGLILVQNSADVGGGGQPAGCWWPAWRPVLSAQQYSRLSTTPSDVSNSRNTNVIAIRNVNCADNSGPNSGVPLSAAVQRIHAAAPPTLPAARKSP